MMTNDQQHHPAPQRDTRACAVVVVDRWTLRLLTSVLAIVCLAPQIAAQESDVTASQSGGVQTNNPRIQSVLQKSGALKRPSSGPNERSSSRSGSTASQKLSARPTVSRSETVEPPESPQVRRASFEEQIQTIRGEKAASDASESSVQQALATSETDTSNVLPAAGTTNAQTADVPDALKKTPERNHKRRSSI